MPACRLTRTIPNLGVTHNLQRWAKLEATKRRTFYMLLRLPLPIPDRVSGRQPSPLLFDFLEDKRSNRMSRMDMVYTGHADGVITINAAKRMTVFAAPPNKKCMRRIAPCWAISGMRWGIITGCSWRQTG